MTLSVPLAPVSSFRLGAKRSVEGFAGCAVWSATLLKRGVVDGALVSEINDNPLHDFRSPQYLSWIFSLLDSGVISVMHLGIECRTFSHACKLALRTPTEVTGRSGLRREPQQLVDSANAYAANAVLALLKAHSLNIPVFAENQQTSMLWSFGQMRDIIDNNGHNGWYAAGLCYCRFGKLFQKRKTIISNRHQVLRFAKKCQCVEHHTETIIGQGSNTCWLEKQDCSCGSLPTETCNTMV